MGFKYCLTEGVQHLPSFEVQQVNFADTPQQGIEKHLTW